MINYNHIKTFVHEYDFPIHDLVYPFIEDIVDQFYKNINLDKGYNIPYSNPYLENLILPKFINLIKKNYDVDDMINTPLLFIYIQNNINASSPSDNLHHHIKTSTLNAVFYVNLPKKGGGLQFLLGEHYHNLQPQINKLYVFPSWLYHRPLPQQDTDYRICFNLEYFCKQRPIHKKTGIIF